MDEKKASLLYENASGIFIFYACGLKRNHVILGLAAFHPPFFHAIK